MSILLQTVDAKLYKNSPTNQQTVRHNGGHALCPRHLVNSREPKQNLRGALARRRTHLKS
eukprot:7922990-Pyramimonas_sp.AAC.1